MLLIPESIWSSMLEAFASTPGNVERVAYLDGIRQADHGVVTTLTLPNATLKPFNYVVDADAAKEAGRHLRAHGLIRLAQVHTHPNRQVGHSGYDDEHAYAQTPGAISIVLPDHARHHPLPYGRGVHIKERGDWLQVAEGEVEQVVRLLPSFVDLRAPEPERKRRRWLPWRG
jgi:hypothetical protein